MNRVVSTFALALGAALAAGACDNVQPQVQPTGPGPQAEVLAPVGQVGDPVAPVVIGVVQAEEQGSRFNLPTPAATYFDPQLGNVVSIAIDPTLVREPPPGFAEGPGAQPARTP